MNKKRAVLLLLIVPALAVSCRSRTDRSEGTVLLTVSHFDGLPKIISLTDELNNAGTRLPFSIGTITLLNTAKDPSGTTGPLQDIQLRSYEATYRRRDTGTRVPPPITQGLFGTVPVNSSSDFINLTYMLSSQLEDQPLKDLRDFGIDRETGTAVIVIDVSLRFFGRTLSGDEIASEPAVFTLEVRP
jgi:hypothetical protein